MRITNRRRIHAWLLLSVFIPMLLTTILHRHYAEPGQDHSVCIECLHHIHHSGHLTGEHTQIDKCLLCQLCALPYLQATAIVLSVVFFTAFQLLSKYNYGITRKITLCISSRGPPFYLLK